MIELTLDQKKKLAEIYLGDSDSAYAIALVCDWVLDKSGSLLGEVRDLAYQMRDDKKNQDGHKS